MAPMLPSIITKLFGWAVALFYDVERTGPGLVPGPVLVTPNHPNMGVDAIVVFHTGGRQTRWLGKAPLGRMGSSNDVAAATFFLLSPESAWISGANLVVDGGMSSVSRW